MLTAFHAIKICYCFTCDSCLAPLNPISKLLKTTLSNVRKSNNSIIFWFGFLLIKSWYTSEMSKKNKVCVELKHILFVLQNWLLLLVFREGHINPKVFPSLHHIDEGNLFTPKQWLFHVLVHKSPGTLIGGASKKTFWSENAIIIFGFCAWHILTWN